MVSKGQMLLVIGVAAIVVAAGAFVVLTGSPPEEDDKLKVVASFYPLAYMAGYIGGDKVSVATLIPYNTEVHSWSPSPSDILKANQADVILYNGAGLDPWVEEDLLPAISTSGKVVVETTHGIKLIEGGHEHSVTRLFVIDNDNNRTLVFDVEEENAALLTSLAVKMMAVPTFSGHFDSPPAVLTSGGYVHIYLPDATKVTVIDTGLHGDHFHDPEIVTQIAADKPIHYAVSDGLSWVAYTEDGSKKTLIINVSAPGNFLKVDNGGTSSTSHATLVFDGSNMLYSADMRTSNGSNLQILYPENGTVSFVGAGGVSPHGGFYSPATGKVYFNCADGIAVVGEGGWESLIPYGHAGPVLKRSWLSHNGTWLVSYVGNASAGLEYDTVLAYDLVSGRLVQSIDVNVTKLALAEYGWSNSEYVEHDDIVVLADGKEGKVHLVSVGSGEISSVGLNGTWPQPLRVTVDEQSESVWAVSGDGKAYRIHIEDAEVEAEYDLGISDLGKNLVLAAVTAMNGGSHDHGEDEHDHGLYDPHTWISPHIAKQQAQRIRDALMAKDPANSTHYAGRYNALAQNFDDLDSEYLTIKDGKVRESIFVAHGAFGYLADRYGFSQESVIGISANEQPSPTTIAALVKKMVDSQTYYVFFDPVYSDAYVNTLKANVESASGHSVTVLRIYLMTGPVDDKDYLEQMRFNLENIKEGLGVS